MCGWGGGGGGGGGGGEDGKCLFSLKCIYIIVGTVWICLTKLIPINSQKIRLGCSQITRLQLNGWTVFFIKESVLYLFKLLFSAKGRRQPKAAKPKKMIRLESQNIVYATCNNGSSAVITKDGGLYMFGKDTAHCHQGSGTYNVHTSS